MQIVLYQKQHRFLASSAASVTFQGGAGSGKTRAGCAKALVTALVNPGCRGMIVGASYPGLKQAIMPHLEAVADELGLRRAWQHNRADNQITLPNGSSFWLRSADNPESLLGADLAWAWGDEVGLWKRDAYRYLTGRLRQPGYPHQFFATYTPKGRNWTFDELGQDRDGLEVIHATSLENPFVDEDFRERLRREYGEGSPFWRQEVLGEFVTFEGLVYPHFGEQHIGVPAPGLAIVRTVIGVDWGWANPGVMIVVSLDAQDHTWAREEVYERERGLDWWIEQGRRLEGVYGRGVGFYCDPSEPANIDAFRRAGLNAVAANNAVIPGITAVAARINGDREHVAPECVNLLSEYRAYSWKRQRDGTIKADEPEKIFDHACLVAGTLIATARGQVPIEQVRVGENVITRNGLRPVLAAGQSGLATELYTARFSNGRILTGTGDHPVWIAGEGYTFLQALRYGDIIETLPREEECLPCLRDRSGRARQRLSFTGDASSGAIRRHRVPAGAPTTSPEVPTVRRGCAAYTKRSGRITSGRYLLGTIFTTLQIGSTTARRTWPVSSAESTCGITVRRRAKSSGQRPGSALLRRRSRHGNGIDLKKGERGTGTTVYVGGRSGCRSHLPASIVGRPSSQLVRWSSTVQTTASQRRAVQREWITRSGLASSAGRPSPSIATLRPAPVPVHVVSVSRSQLGMPIPVYNLTIADDHEYFANGVLTHNCDARRYAEMALLAPRFDINKWI